MKPHNKKMLRQRAEAAILDMYHNATIPYGGFDDADGLELSDSYFDNWLGDLAACEIDYIRSGGAYGSDFAATLRAPCNGGKCASAKAQNYYVRKGLRSQRLERLDCGMLTGWRVLEIACGNKRIEKLMDSHDATERHNSLWERITEYGKLYQHGRGGRTLAPNDLINSRGMSWGCNGSYADEMQAPELVELIQIVESFNRTVKVWCNSVPEQWNEHIKELSDEREAEHQEAILIETMRPDNCLHGASI